MWNDADRMRKAIEECREMVDGKTAEEDGRLRVDEPDECVLCGEKLLPELDFFESFMLFR